MTLSISEVPLINSFSQASRSSFVIYPLQYFPLPVEWKHLSLQSQYELFSSLRPFHISSGYGLFRTMTGVGERVNTHHDINSSQFYQKSGKNESLASASTSSSIKSSSYLNAKKQHEPKINFLNPAQSHGWGLAQPTAVARPEIVLEAWDQSARDWKEIEFRFKPGHIFRAPEFVLPYQPRLDWQMWFAALGSYAQNPWFVQFIKKLLENSSDVIQLLHSGSPQLLHSNQHRFILPITKIRATLYLYDFTRWDTPWARRLHNVELIEMQHIPADQSHLPWWNRCCRQEYLVELTNDNQSLLQFVKQYGWGWGKEDIQTKPFADIIPSQNQALHVNQHTDSSLFFLMSGISHLVSTFLYVSQAFRSLLQTGNGASSYVDHQYTVIFSILIIFVTISVGVDNCSVSKKMDQPQAFQKLKST
jgi:hypothetical protein